MKIEIEYNGAFAKCRITELENPNSWKNFNDADKMSQVYALSAFNTIQEHFKREQNTTKNKGINEGR